MAKTPLRGYTIPAADGSDDIGDLPGLIIQGFTDVENAQFLGIDSKIASDTYDTYPRGIAQMGLSAAHQVSDGWPHTGNGSGCVLLSIRRQDGTYTFQLLMQSSGTSSGPVIWSRSGNANGWSPWRVVASPGLPTAMASGQISLTPPSGGGTVVGTVLFPTARFSTAPRVQLTPVTTTPGNVQVSLNTLPSADQVQVALYRSDGATGTSIQWTATQGVD